MTPDAAGPNADQITYWNEVSGAKWVANQDRLDRLMAPLGAALLAKASAREGEFALDVGCGCGDVSLRLADAVGSHGRVTGIDISQPMLAHAEARRAALVPRDRAKVRWVRADAMTHSFAADADLIVSRFGVMFFDDRPRAFANLRAALRPGGRFAFVCWRRRSEVDWMRAPMDWIASVFPTPEETAGEVGPFALADAEATIRLLSEAGFHDVTADPLDCPVTLGEAMDSLSAIDDALRLLTETGPAAALTRGGPPADRATSAALMRAGLAARFPTGPVVLSAACWVYSGRG